MPPAPSGDVDANISNRLQQAREEFHQRLAAIKRDLLAGHDEEVRFANIRRSPPERLSVSRSLPLTTPVATAFDNTQSSGLQSISMTTRCETACHLCCNAPTPFAAPTAS